MDIRYKSFELAETKATGTKGQFTALVSVFNNVDRVGDRINPGSYTKTLEKWRQSGDPLPIILSHRWDDVMAHIGVADPRDVKQTPKGLLVKGTLDVADNPVAAQVYKLMKRRSLKEFSIGYRVPPGGEQFDADTGINDIFEIDLVEAGPTLKGANQDTELLGVKSALDLVSPRAVASEEDLRRQTAALDRAELARTLPADAAAPAQEGVDTDPAPGPAPAAPDPPADDDDLRRRAAALERERLAADLPTYEVEPPPAPAPPAPRAPVPPPALPAPASELRRRSDRLERERVAEGLPDHEVEPPAPAPPRESAPPPRLPAAERDLRKRFDQMERGDVDLPTYELEAEPPPAPREPVPPPRLPPTEAELRKRADRELRRRIELPGYELDPPAAPEPRRREPAPEPRLPASEGELRKRADREERRRVADGLPGYELDAPPAEPPAPAEPASVEDLSRRIAALEREQQSKSLPDLPTPDPEPRWEDFIPRDELEGAKTFLKAVWTAAYINDLPDSAFLYVEPGGEKDGDGKTTPRSLRHFPVKDAEGNVDMPHLRNALSRIPQSDLPESVKDQCVAKARRMMDDAKKEPPPAAATTPQAVDATQGPAKAQPRDDLRRRSLQTVLELQSDGVSTRASKPIAPATKPPEPPPATELRQRSRDAILQVLTGDMQ